MTTRLLQSSCVFYRPEYEPVLKDTRRKTIELADLGHYLEELYGDLWQQASPIILTYTLWLLKTEGRRYRKVKDYAIEVLKTFGQVLVPREIRRPSKISLIFTDTSVSMSWIPLALSRSRESPPDGRSITPGIE